MVAIILHMYIQPRSLLAGFIQVLAFGLLMIVSIAFFQSSVNAQGLDSSTLDQRFAEADGEATRAEQLAETARLDLEFAQNVQPPDPGLVQSQNAIYQSRLSEANRLRAIANDLQGQINARDGESGGEIGSEIRRDENDIYEELRNIINFLSAGVGIVVVGVIVVGGIQYASSSGDPQKTGAAKTRIAQGITGLILWLLSSVILNFLVPGGIFS